MHKLRDSHGDPEEDLRAKLETVAGRRKVYVLGLGNTDRADDGAGVLVANALKKPFPSHSYSEHDGIEGVVLDLSDKTEDLVVFFVDAANLGLKAGSIRVIDKDDIREAEITTHRVAVALMAAMLERAGKKAAVICIQPQRIEFRGPVSKPVKAAIDELVEALRQVIGSRR
ncbi:MAG TPA: hydrogenase maturation protease [Thermoplasmata archaeon]|nr:hydrogenase maturation protease [Thermoplasmata archaeon]